MSEPKMIALKDRAMSHTPGPWTYFYKHKYDEWHVVIPFEGSSMNRALCPDGIQSNNREADARLMAAAPDLLEALCGVLRVADRKTDEFDAARAAIAKATADVLAKET